MKTTVSIIANSNSIQFNSIQFFILTCWLNSYNNQLQSSTSKQKIENTQVYAKA
jgi:hypothetical protein